jgi:hypothetical protein
VAQFATLGTPVKVNEGVSATPKMDVLKLAHAEVIE